MGCSWVYDPEPWIAFNGLLKRLAFKKSDPGKRTKMVEVLRIVFSTAGNRKPPAEQILDCHRRFRPEDRCPQEPIFARTLVRIKDKNCFSAALLCLYGHMTHLALLSQIISVVHITPMTASYAYVYSTSLDNTFCDSRLRRSKLSVRASRSFVLMVLSAHSKPTTREDSLVRIQTDLNEKHVHELRVWEQRPNPHSTSTFACTFRTRDDKPH